MDTPNLKTGRLICPPQADLAPLPRDPRWAAGAAFEGQPDGQSTAQRTLHQSLLNRHISGSPVYTNLRAYGFTVRWGYQPDPMPLPVLNLALCHSAGPNHTAGPNLGVILRTDTSRLDAEDVLLQQGWHLLIMEPSAVVQTPQDAVDALLAVMAYLGCEALTTVERGHGDDLFGPNSLRHPIGLPRRTWRRVWRGLRLPMAGAFLAGCLTLGLHLGANPDAATGAWPSGMALRTRIASVALSPDGHALVGLANGKQTFVPAHALRRNPERLHRLIVAWRQGRPLTLFATSTEHKVYGRQVGIREVPVSGLGSAANRSQDRR